MVAAGSRTSDSEVQNFCCRRGEEKKKNMTIITN